MDQIRGADGPEKDISVNEPRPINYATDDQRVRAYFVDFAIFLVPGAIIVLAYRYLHLDRDLSIVLGLLLNLSYLTYRAYMHVRSGQTLGKMLLKIKVVRSDQRPVGIREAVLRQVTEIAFFMVAIPRGLAPAFELIVIYVVSGWILAILKVLFAIDGLAMIHRSDRRAMHDLIGGTIVIRHETHENARIPTT